MEMTTSKDNRKSIFVVEDSADIRDLLRILYEREGYDVSFAHDGSEALEKLQNASEPPGVILLDLQMQGMDGEEFRTQQLRDPKIASIPVLLMTGRSEAEIASKNIGAQGFLKKPVSLDTFLAVAKKYCN